MFLYRGSSRADDSYIGKGRILHKDSDGNCKIYRKSVKCNYPGCNGQVYLIDAPDRHQDVLKPRCVGECADGGKHHTYKIEPNWIARPWLFDWRKKEDSTNK